VGLKSLKSLNLTNGYPNKNKKNNKKKNNNNKVKSKPLELFELAGKKYFVLCKIAARFRNNNCGCFCQITKLSGASVKTK
jgi:hypothetical protein